MNEEDHYFEELSNSIVDSFLHDDNYYECLATPLKPAKVIKMQERRELANALQFKAIRSQMKTAEELLRINLKNLVSEADFYSIITELDRAPTHFEEKISSLKKEEEEKEKEEEEKVISLQELFGFSNETLMHFYELVCSLVAQNEFEKANAILVFLEMLAPHISSYWIAHGVNLQAMQKYLEAIEVFSLAKSLDPKDPEPSFSSLECYLALNEKEKAKFEKETLTTIISEI
jgi:tetratricopeptide (TPR) repeat protein